VVDALCFHEKLPLHLPTACGQRLSSQLAGFMCEERSNPEQLQRRRILLNPRSSRPAAKVKLKFEFDKKRCWNRLRHADPRRSRPKTTYDHAKYCAGL
jgi:hypothetical protein